MSSQNARVAFASRDHFVVWTSSGEEVHATVSGRAGRDLAIKAKAAVTGWQGDASGIAGCILGYEQFFTFAIRASRYPYAGQTGAARHGAAAGRA